MTIDTVLSDLRRITRGDEFEERMNTVIKLYAKRSYPQDRHFISMFYFGSAHSFLAIYAYRQEIPDCHSGRVSSPPGNGKGTPQTTTKIPPRRDLELDALVEVLDGKRMVHCHSYRQDEILMLTRIADDFGFTIGVFQHVLEGYKIAERIAEHGAGASTFTDWWAYKIEVIDAIPYNGSLMHDVGVVTSFNSDSDELARRLNTEAAKGVKYGGLSKEEALKFVTLNPAIQLKIDKWVGSLEEGKDADFVIWSDNPLSTYAVCEQTWIDGINYFNLIRDRKMRKKIKRERNELIQKILSSKDNSKGETMTPSGHEYELSHPFNCLKGVIR
ncbi:MAG: amidohydrolase family protein [Candidatus Marinimicrobia bacterium]|nr:amidohydrolase family protein [Candidatus Neomarinimicrobiota bacterium]